MSDAQTPRGPAVLPFGRHIFERDRRPTAQDALERRQLDRTGGGRT